jgi:hypothetical protein
MKALNRLLAVLAALALPVAALAQAAASDYTFQLKGFVSMSAAVQSGRFNVSPGQQTLSSGSPELATDKGTMSFDVRQSRFNFSVKGPQVMFGATPTAVLELDFFGGNSAGNYGNVSIYPRMRTAYTQLDWGNHKLQIGQQNDLTFAMAPTSISHIAFPLGYETGNIGWRRPGIFGFHTLPLADDLKLELAWEIGRSQWADATVTNGFTAGEASGAPAFQGRATVSNKMFTAWVAGHYSALDTDGAGTAGPDTSITTTAVAAGGKVSYMGVTAAATGFTGKNTGPLLGQFLNFSVGPVGDEDVSTTGYWAQVGYNLTKEFSLWAFYGNQKVDAADATKIALPQRENTTMNFQAMYRDGGFGTALEYIDFKTKYGTYVGGALTATTETKANQIMLTGTYFF